MCRRPADPVSHGRWTLARVGSWRNLHGWRLVFVVLLTSLTILKAQSTSEFPAGTLEIIHEEGLEGAARRVRDIWNESRARVELKTRLIHPHPTQIRLVRNQRGFLEVLRTLGGSPRPDHTAAVAFPYRDIIVMKTDAWRHGGIDRFENIFIHELTHLYIGAFERQYPESLLPLWFHEGVCQWVSDRVFTGDDQTFQRLGDDRPAMQALAEAFPSDAEGSAAAYAQSLSFVRFLAGYGTDYPDSRGNIPSLFWIMSQGKSLDEALRVITKGREFSELEREWAGGLRGRFLFRLSDLPHFLFTGLLLVLLVLGYAGARVRRKRRLAAMEADDPPAESDVQSPGEPMNLQDSWDSPTDADKPK